MVMRIWAGGVAWRRKTEGVCCRFWGEGRILFFGGCEQIFSDLPVAANQELFCP